MLLLNGAPGFCDRVGGLATRVRTPKIILIVVIVLRLLARSLLDDGRGAFPARLAFLNGGANALGYGFVLVTVIGRKIGLSQRGHRELIANLVLLVARVAFDPTELDLMHFAQRQQPGPKVDVDGALGVGAPPILLFPGGHPAFHHRLHHVLRIAVERDLAGLLQQFEARNGGEDFHPVVGGQTKAAAGFRALPGMQYYHAIIPSLAGAGDSNRSGNGERSSAKPKARKGRTSGCERVNVAAGRMRVVREKPFLRPRRDSARIRRPCKFPRTALRLRAESQVDADSYHMTKSISPLVSSSESNSAVWQLHS